MVIPLLLAGDAKLIHSLSCACGDWGMFAGPVLFADLISASGRKTVTQYMREEL